MQALEGENNVSEEPTSEALPELEVKVKKNTRKPYVLSEARKASLAKANATRQEYREMRKMDANFLEKMEEKRKRTISEVNTFFDSTLENTKNWGAKELSQAMPSSSSEVSEPPLTIEKTPQPQEVDSSEEESESDTEVEEVVKKPTKKSKKAKKVSKRVKPQKPEKKRVRRVVVESSSEESESSSESDSEYERTPRKKKNKRFKRRRRNDYDEPEAFPNNLIRASSYGSNRFHY